MNLIRFRSSNKGKTQREMWAEIEEASKHPRKFGPLEALKLDGQGFPLPFWKSHPQIGRGSIGWRMGDGEDYAIAWHRWYAELGRDVRRQYQKQYPEVGDWAGFYDSIEEK